MCNASWLKLANIASPANLTITARTALKFCARSRSQSKNIFDLGAISLVSSSKWEPWPECHCLVFWYLILHISLHGRILSCVTYAILCNAMRLYEQQCFISPSRTAGIKSCPFHLTAKHASPMKHKLHCCNKERQAPDILCKPIASVRVGGMTLPSSPPFPKTSILSLNNRRGFTQLLTLGGGLYEKCHFDLERVFSLSTSTQISLDLSEGT